MKMNDADDEVPYINGAAIIVAIIVTCAWVLAHV